MLNLQCAMREREIEREREREREREGGLGLHSFPESPTEGSGAGNWILQPTISGLSISYNLDNDVFCQPECVKHAHRE